jgi:sugar O-acyltransferase (sialic acid O-acetyltransferase NeuD family)
VPDVQIAVYGAGGFGREVAWMASACRIGADPCRAVCFIDDDPSHLGLTMHALPVMGLAEARQRYPDALAAVAVGSPQVRQRMAEKAAAAGFAFATLIHPGVERSEWVEVGEGTVICAGNNLTVDIVIGQQVQINLDCTIGHDVVMADYSTLAPGVHVSGYVHLGKRVYLGTGAVIINGTPDEPLVIGDDTVVGAGACVTKSIPAGQVVVGVPARPLEKRQSS